MCLRGVTTAHGNSSLSPRASYPLLRSDSSGGGGHGVPAAAAEARRNVVQCAVCGCPAGVGGGGHNSIAFGTTRHQALAAVTHSPRDIRGALVRAVNSRVADAGAAGGGAGAGARVCGTVRRAGGAVVGSGIGLLYAQCGTLRPLCCWCVETGCAPSTVESALQSAAHEYLGQAEFPGFPYCRALMKGLPDGVLD